MMPRVQMALTDVARRFRQHQWEKRRRGVQTNAIEFKGLIGAAKRRNCRTDITIASEFAAINKSFIFHAKPLDRQQSAIRWQRERGIREENGDAVR